MHVLRAHPVETGQRFEGAVPGRVIRVRRASGAVEVLTGDGVLSIDAVAGEQGAELEPATLIRSVRDTLGIRPGALLRRLEELEAKLHAEPGSR